MTDRLIEPYVPVDRGRASRVSYPSLNLLPRSGPASCSFIRDNILLSLGQALHVQIGILIGYHVMSDSHKWL